MTKAVDAHNHLTKGGLIRRCIVKLNNIPASLTADIVGEVELALEEFVDFRLLFAVDAVFFGFDEAEADPIRIVVDILLGAAVELEQTSLVGEAVFGSNFCDKSSCFFVVRDVATASGIDYFPFEANVESQHVGNFVCKGASVDSSGGPEEPSNFRAILLLQHFIKNTMLVVIAPIG